MEEGDPRGGAVLAPVLIPGSIGGQAPPHLASASADEHSGRLVGLDFNGQKTDIFWFPILSLFSFSSILV
jgi:hypothetical protein